MCIRDRVRPLKIFFSRFGGTPYVRVVADVLGSAFQRMYKTRNLDAVYALVPYMLIIMEMREIPGAIDLMIEGVESTDDLWGWIDYLTLPIGGWEGDRPDVAMLEIDDNSSILLDYFFGSAIAARTPRGRRVNGKEIGEKILNAIRDVGDDFNGKDLTDTMKSVSSALRNPGALSIRSLASTRAMLTAGLIAGRAARNNWENFLKGKSSARIPAPLVLAILGYLATETKEGGKLSSDELKPEVFKLVASALVDITSSTTLDEENPPSDEKADAAEKAFALNPTFLWHSGGAHGAMFHMAMVAYYTLTGTEIKHIEKERVVALYNEPIRENTPVFSKRYRDKKRRVDIILETGDATTNNSLETWVELKSLRMQKVTNKVSAIEGDGLKTFGGIAIKKTLGKNFSQTYKKSFYNKQFNLDRVSSTIGAFTNKIDGERGVNIIVRVSDEFIWWFQDFKTCLLYTSPSPRDRTRSRMPSSA